MKDINEILKKIMNRKVKDYSFIIGFFFVFSFFLFFIIRPNVSTVFTLNRELDELKQVDASYENVIMHIVDLQSKLEENRDNLYLLDAALPTQPQVNKIVDDIRLSASSSGIVIKKLDISDVNLKDSTNKKDAKNFEVIMEIASPYPDSIAFVRSLINQRRLKSIKSMTFSRAASAVGTVSTASGSLILRLEVEGFYL